MLERGFKEKLREQRDYDFVHCADSSQLYCQSVPAVELVREMGSKSELAGTTRSATSTSSPTLKQAARRGTTSDIKRGF